MNSIERAKLIHDLLDIGHEIRTQDNLATEDPMFCVQELKRDYGYSTQWVDDFVWIHDGEIVPEGTDGAIKSGYKDRWETVMVAFTKKGCLEYLQLNGHNHWGKTRVYAQSFRRCPEMVAIRQAFLAKWGEDE